MAKRYDVEFKKQVVAESLEVGNMSLVARRHGLSQDTVTGWVKESKRIGSPVGLPRKAGERNTEIAKRLEEASSENARLKRIVADSAVEISILRELLEKANPR